MHLLNSCLAAVFLLHIDVAPGTFVYAGCSPSRYAPNTAFESNLNSLLASMASTASSGATYSTFTSGAGPEAESESVSVSAAGVASAAYGLYQCRGDQRPGECEACVRDTVARLGAVCAGATAASLQSDGCYVRYGAVRDLVGRRALADDTSVAYHRCSAGTSGDTWFLRSRDAVLSDLQGGVDANATATAAASSGGYKVSASGPVRGVAQCLGGLAAADCTSCLAQLHGTCGAALAADVELVQCSVRYWTNADYVRSSPQGNPEDDAGRTVAIAIGISAGVAALVVFVSFLRKACSS